MSSFLIKNLEEAKIFNEKLESYWKKNPSWDYATEIFNYYKNEENYPYIDTQINNSMALALAIISTETDFIKLLFNSEKIQHKLYSLRDVSEIFFISTSIPSDNIKLIISTFENQKNIFNDFNHTNQNYFIKSCIVLFFSSGFLDGTQNHEYFFDFIKNHNLNIYDDESNPTDKSNMNDKKFNIMRYALYNGNTVLLNKIINNASSEEDKVKVIYKDLSNIYVSQETIDFMKFKKKEYETYLEYKELSSRLNNSQSSILTKKVKI
jgi:hypothetical protein